MAGAGAAAKVRQTCLVREIGRQNHPGATDTYLNVILYFSLSVSLELLDFPPTPRARAPAFRPFRWPLWSHMGYAQLRKWVRGRPAAPSVVPGCRRLCANACVPYAGLAGVGPRRLLATNLMAESPKNCGIALLVGVQVDPVMADSLLERIHTFYFFHSFTLILLSGEEVQQLLLEQCGLLLLGEDGLIYSCSALIYKLINHFYVTIKYTPGAVC